jgi:DNA-binding transcriptional MerR regulator
MRIGDLAKATRKSARALRLYEEMGLLVPGERSAGGFRLYGADAIERVHWIGKLQELGLSLGQIQEAVREAADAGAPRDAMAAIRRLFEQRYMELNAQMTKLAALKDEVQDAIRYLDGCAPCQTADAGPSACTACDEHDGAAPVLVKGVTHTAAETQTSNQKSEPLRNKSPR